MNKIIGIIVLFSFILTLGVVSANITDYDSINLEANTYTYTPTPAIAGEEFELWIQLTNNGNITANNVVYYLDIEYPFILLDEDSQGTITQLAGYQSKVVKYKLKTSADTLEGTYELEFKITREGSEVTVVEKLSIDIKGDSALVDIVSSNVEKASIGAESLVTLNLKNLGEKDAKDVFITLDDSSDDVIKVIDLKTQYIPKLVVDSEQEVNFKITVAKGATQNSYTLPITITYSDADNNYSVSRDVGVRIADNPEMRISVLSAGTNYKLKALTEETLSLEIYNIGNVDAESVYIELETEVANEVANYFIGSIEKDNYDSVDFKFKTKNLTGEYPISIIVHYKDSSLKEQTITKEITVEMIKSTNGGAGKSIVSTILSIIALIVGLSLLIVILKWLSKILIRPAWKIVKEIFKRKKKRK